MIIRKIIIQAKASVKAEVDMITEIIRLIQVKEVDKAHMIESLIKENMIIEGRTTVQIIIDLIMNKYQPIIAEVITRIDLHRGNELAIIHVLNITEPDTPETTIENIVTRKTIIKGIITIDKEVAVNITDSVIVTTTEEAPATIQMIKRDTEEAAGNIIIKAEIMKVATVIEDLGRQVSR